MPIQARSFKSFLALLFLAIPAIASDGTFTDPRDGKKYRTAKIGEQVWMAENLNYDEEGGDCYKNESSNCQKYGRLYDWSTAKVVCPKGWHLPSEAAWSKLMYFIGGYKTAGKKLKAKSGWNDYEGESGNGTDDFGFSALPGGYGYSDGYFYNVGDCGYWWSASEFNSGYAYCRDKDYYFEYAGWYDGSKSFLFSVRCLQD
jgi:uncharacterized protein (TIGR02145 family)